MKKDIVTIFTRTLYALFAIATVIMLWIVYKDIKTNIAVKFGMGYLFLTFFLLIYMAVITILKSRKLQRADIKRRLITFCIIFVLLSTLNYAFDYIFTPSKINLSKNISIAFGLAFGISFLDITLKKAE